jgi:predicted glycoside hydrolase/deacetylase ChbG (UPF0249 family)
MSFENHKRDFQMRYLIVNADDYGMTPGVSRGIREVHQRGIVTSTSVMIGMAGADDAVKLAQSETPTLGLGLHFTLAGKTMLPVLPPEQIPSLVRTDGCFYDEPVWSQINHQFDEDEITNELHAQFNRFVQVANRLPTHFDSHYHAAYRHPASMSVMRALAAQHDLPLRYTGEFDTPLLKGLSHPSNFRGIEHSMTVDDIVKMLRDLPDEEITELMCHPGYVDETLPRIDSWTTVRELEMGWLTDQRVREAISAAGITLTSFDIFQTKR